MKISVGSKIIDGPFGGGNEFLKNLIRFLNEKGHTVVNHLNDKDIDIILLTNPLISSETSSFNSYDIEFYLKFHNSQALVFQRFNECDERKGTKNINYKLNKFNQVIDINLFVSDWLKNVFNEFALSKKKSYVVMGGPNKDIFNNDNVPTRSEVMEKLIPYIQEETAKGVQLNHIMRHTVGLFHGQNGSRTWKQYLSKNMCIRDADLQKVNHIMDQVKKTNPVSLER